MGGSGIEELLEQIYASNVIHHILSGKAFSRALRGHLLVDTVLQTLIVEDMVESSLITEEIIERLASFESGDDITEEYQSIFEQFQAELSKWKRSQ